MSKWIHNIESARMSWGMKQTFLHVYMNTFIWFVLFIWVCSDSTGHAKKLGPICQVRTETELSHDVDFIYGLQMEAANWFSHFNLLSNLVFEFSPKNYLSQPDCLILLDKVPLKWLDLLAFFMHRLASWLEPENDLVTAVF